MYIISAMDPQILNIISSESGILEDISHSHGDKLLIFHPEKKSIVIETKKPIAVPVSEFGECEKILF